MKIDISKDSLGTSLIVQTNDWGIYAIKQFAVPSVDLDIGTFNGSCNPSIQSVVDVLEQYSNLWVMKCDKDVGYPNYLLKDKLVTAVSDEHFERIFNINEIKKISCEPVKFSDWKNSQTIYVVKAPKITLLGSLGVYLDSKFK